jgi:chemotaxis protein MotB
MALGARRKGRTDSYHWPGFVDAMATLLLMLIFLLSIFMVAQFMLARDITGRDSALSQLKSQIAELSELLALEKQAKRTLEATLTALSDDLASAKAANTSLRVQLGDSRKQGTAAGGRIATLTRGLTDQKKITAQALAQVALLNQQLAAVRRQIAALQAALVASEARDKKSKTQIVDLGKRLNAALAQRVQELSRYRSDFFGKLREILGDRSDIRIVGDRFVFQSEVLFAKGEAKLNLAGQTEMKKLAGAIKQLEGQIPATIKWVLRVDGHTDADPIQTTAFPSNWELSTARAISVVRFLINEGIPAKRLVAAGFGEFQPLDPGTGEEAFKRNRRIELKLTER